MMFKNRSHFTKVNFLGLWLFLLTVGCQPIANEDNQAVISTQVISNQPATPLSTSTPVIINSPIPPPITPTWTLTPSPTSSPTSELTPTSLPTETTISTPWPTLAPDEAANIVMSLLADNQNPDCLFPCWWGVTPGQTRWSDVLPYLQSFSLQTYTFPQDSLYVIAYPIPSSISYLEELHIGYSYNESDIVTSIDIPSINIEGYDAKTMVTLYGIPNEVWLTTIAEPREGVLPFQLIIVYQQQGISLRYYMDATKSGDMITACFEPGVVEEERPDLFPIGPRIFVWEPGETKTIQEISPIPLERYFPLETKTDLTPQTLYEKFINPDELPCIDTPADLWKN